MRCVMPDQLTFHKQAPTKSFSCFVGSPNELPNAGPTIRVEQHNECTDEQKLSKVASYEVLIAYTAAADFPMPTFIPHHRCGGCQMFFIQQMLNQAYIIFGEGATVKDNFQLSLKASEQKKVRNCQILFSS